MRLLFGLYLQSEYINIVRCNSRMLSAWALQLQHLNMSDLKEYTFFICSPLFGFLFILFDIYHTDESALRSSLWKYGSHRIVSPGLGRHTGLKRQGGITDFLSREEVLEWARQFCFDWHEAKTHQHLFVLSLCIRRRWRGLILHSRVDRSLVCFIHFAWRDACLSWLDASLHFTSALHTPNNASILFATGILWGDCLGLLLLYTFSS